MMRFFLCWCSPYVLVLTLVLSLCGEKWSGCVEGSRLLSTSHNSNSITNHNHHLRLITKKNILRNHLHYDKIRGGWNEGTDMQSNMVAEGQTDSLDHSNAEEELLPQPPVSILVSTSYGSTFLDKKKKFQVLKSMTVMELKTMIEQKFPGLPPIALQRLFYGSRLLSDHETIGEIMGDSPLPVLPLLLDMISGTASYNKTMSVHQAIEAYVSSVVQLTFLGDKMRSQLPHHPVNPSESTFESTHSKEEVVNDSVMDTFYYRQLFDLVNTTVYERYSEDIAAALEAERNPEIINEETKLWRGENQKKPSPLSAALAKEFDLNMNGVKNFIYYSLILVVFATLGTASEGPDFFVISMIPLLWISKLRQFRLLWKIVLNAILIELPKFEILMPLFPVTLQVIANESKHWASEGYSESLDDEKVGAFNDEEDQDEEYQDEEDQEEEDGIDDSYSEEQDEEDTGDIENAEAADSAIEDAVEDGEEINHDSEQTEEIGDQQNDENDDEVEEVEEEYIDDEEEETVEL